MSEIVTIDQIQKVTDEFLGRHWHLNQLDTTEVPAWKGPYSFFGNVPNGDKQGCYALINGNEVVYIGLGISRGYGTYEGHGIGARLNNHVLKWDRNRPPKDKRRFYMPRKYWKDKLTGIHTIGFPRRYGYMACALEAFLISELPIPLNIQSSSVASY
ncbi:MAG: hypothetical protein JRJ75_17950 [Deltaproteobacteria bacterium]|nr:hypothetical protein [Deltaproteobacteria bacterium]